MPCACNGGADAQAAASKPEIEYVVTLPNQRTEIVKGEHAAKVAITMAGGGTYRPR